MIVADLLKQIGDTTVRVLAGKAGLSRAVERLAFCEERSTETAFRPKTLYFVPAQWFWRGSPDVDALIRRLAFADASGILVQGERVEPLSGARPGTGLPLATVLLADQLQLPVIDLGRTDVMDWAERIAAHRLNAKLSVYQMTDGILSQLLVAWRSRQSVEALTHLLGTLLNGTCELVARSQAGSDAQDDGVAEDASRAAGLRIREAGDRLHGTADVVLRGRKDTAYLLRCETKNEPGMDAVLCRVLPVAATWIEAAFERRVLAWDARLRSNWELIRALIEAAEEAKPDVLFQAREAGWDADKPHAVVLVKLAVASSDSAIGIADPARALTEMAMLQRESRLIAVAETELRRAWWWALGAVMEPGRFIFVIRRTGEALWGADDLKAVMLEVQKHLEQEKTIGLVSMGIGRAYAGVEGLRRSYREAKEALDLGSLRFGPGTVATIEDVGAERYLYRWYTSPEAQQLIDEMLGPLFDLPVQQRRAMLETIAALVATNGDITRAAERLSLHRNTVRYRLHQFEQRTNVNLSDPENVYLLSLSIRAYQMMEERVARFVQAEQNEGESF
ncbi:MAG: helix-turn-helix domain-containing protein [Hydrogenibacillus sp.]|nr:helix-turn-helix domain-containing protein [Hydrogenibacillus sp.]